MKLSEIKRGKKVTVLSMDMNKIAAERLSKIGLTNGSEVTVIRQAPFNGPIEIKVRGFYVAIRKNQAEQITVKY